MTVIGAENDLSVTILINSKKFKIKKKSLIKNINKLKK